MVLGLAVAPYMITVFSMAERSTPPARTGAAMTMLAATTGLGYAVGSSVAGQLADAGGYRPAFAVTVTAGVLATVLALVAGGVLRFGAYEVDQPARKPRMPRRSARA
jgi:MFS family permease